ncbi:MAG: SET domain-containing protein-lysine N-methyltransferase [Candidatus Sumerlaeia bacterium]|nr:SET domain-containing protein-lysine N-methyltransferase [Candidatus Sumerlaeia bacterium]
MLKVQTRLDRSTIQGLGLYAAEFIPQGTIVWEYHPDIDLVYPAAKVRTLADHRLRNFLCIYAYYSRRVGGYILCGDHARFVNHSESANLTGGPGEVSVANRDIHEGEEITDDYFTYDRPEGDEYVEEFFAFEHLLRPAFRQNGHTHSNGASQHHGIPAR